MRLYSNIPEWLAKLKEVREAVAGTPGGGSGAPPTVDLSDAMFGALNTGVGLMKRRIFNEGKNEDAEGNSLGNYHGGKTRLTKKKLSINSDDADEEKERKKKKRNLNRVRKTDPDGTYTEYEKYRLSRGRQIVKKDLELEGALRRSIETQIERINEGGNRVVIVIGSPEQAKIARYQEQQIGNIRAGLNARIGTAEPAKIFTLSKAEYDIVIDEGNRGIGQVIKNLFE